MIERDHRLIERGVCVEHAEGVGYNSRNHGFDRVPEARITIEFL